MLFHKIQYVGKKPSRPDTVAGTGLIWTPGQVHAVEEDAALKLLKHPDIWESIGTEDVGGKVAEKVEAKKAEAKKKAEKKDKEDPFEVANLDVLDRPALAAYAKRNFGTNLNPVKSKKADMIMTIRQLQNKALAGQE